MNRLYPSANSDEDLFSLFDAISPKTPEPSISPNQKELIRSQSLLRQNNRPADRQRNGIDELDALMGFSSRGSESNGMKWGAVPIVAEAEAMQKRLMEQDQTSTSEVENSLDVQKFGAAMLTVKTELEKAGILNQPELRTSLQQIVQLFQNAHNDIEDLVELGVQQQLQTLQQQGMSIAQELRQASDTESLFQVAVARVRASLKSDRVMLVQCINDTQVTVLAEMISQGQPSLWRKTVPTDCFGFNRSLDETNQLFSAVSDRYNIQLPPYQRHFLERLDLSASLTLPILVNGQTWGLFAVFHKTPHRWQEPETNLLWQVGAELALHLQVSQAEMQFAKATERERTLLRVITKIGQRLDLSSILTTTTQEIRQAFQCDRVGVYRFAEDWSGSFIAESVSAGWNSVIQAQHEDANLRGDTTNSDRCTVRDLSVPATADADTYLQQNRGGDYRRGCLYKQVDDIYTMNFSRCYLETLEKYQCRAYLIVPIFQDTTLWGLLAAYQNSGPRQWQESEIKMLLQLSGSLGVAIKQADYLSQIQEQNRKAAKEAEAERALTKVIDKIRKSFELETIFATAVQESRKLLGIERVAIYKFRPDYYGDILAESKTGDYPSLLGAAWEDPYLQEHQGGRFRNNEVLVTDDVYAAGMTDCHVEALEFFGFRACAVVAIFKGQTLWGLLSAFQHSGPHQWQDNDIRLLSQIAAQLGFALQQSDYLDQLQTQAQEGALAIAREKDGKEQIQRNVLQLLVSVRPALNGDLTVRAPITEDEVGTVADAYNNTLQSLRKLVMQVQSAANQVGHTSQENNRAIADLAQQAQQEAAEIIQALQKMRSMVDSTQAVAKNAQQVNMAVQQANAIVQQGDTAMNRTVDGILGIRETVSETSKKIKRLSESSQKISKVVNLISTFTAQTQLLALNAAIEATRAGEAGRGFAVVADEVRALARQSAEATTEIEKLVQEIQIETSAVATAMDAGIEQVVNGTNLVNETRQSLNEIVSATAQISQLVQAITQATQVQTQQSEAVTETMTEVAAIAQHTSTEAIQISTSFQDLLATAEALQTSIGQFKVE